MGEPLMSVMVSARSRARPGTIPRLLMNLALAIGLSAGGLLIAPTPAFGWDPGAFSRASEDQLVALQNQARASAGLRTLKVDPTLQAAARWRAKDMAQRDYFGHTIKGTDRKVFWYLQYKYDYCFKVAGENLGTLTWEGASAEEVSALVFDMWMNSAGHRTNILAEAWDSIGIGAYRADDGTYVWTVLFADRCGSATTSAKPTPASRNRPRRRPTSAYGEADTSAYGEADTSGHGEADPSAYGEADTSDPHRWQSPGQRQARPRPPPRRRPRNRPQRPWS